VAGIEPEREQFYLEASLLKLKNIYTKWQVKNKRENSSTWRPACLSSRISTANGRYRTSERTVLPAGQPAQAQEYLQQWQVKNQRENSSTWGPACSSSRISAAGGRLGTSERIVVQGASLLKPKNIYDKWQV
jgi:hypothetical protein